MYQEDWRQVQKGILIGVIGMSVAILGIGWILAKYGREITKFIEKFLN